MAKTTKTTKTGTAPVSKYAAKKAMLAKGIIPNSTDKVSENTTETATKINASIDPIDTPTVNVTEIKTRQVGKVLIVGHGPISKALEKNVATYKARDSSYGVSSDKDDNWNDKTEKAIERADAIHNAIADEIAKDGQSIMKELENTLDNMGADLAEYDAISEVNFDTVRQRIKSSKLLITAYGRQTLHKEIHDFMNQGMISTSQGLELLNIVNHKPNDYASKLVEVVEKSKDDVKIAQSKLDKLQSMVTKRDPVKKQQVIPTEVDTHATINPNSKDKRKSGLPDSSAPYPEHVTELALLMKNNAEIRRFTALAIVTYLAQKKIISGNRPNVTFKWDNFTVKVNGFQRTYKYTEAFFLNCLMVAFVSFSKSAQNTIGRFTKVEKNKSLSESIDLNEITRLASLIEPKTKSK